jgi:endonuclease YncB( thermonuclease family)
MRVIFLVLFATAWLGQPTPAAAGEALLPGPFDAEVLRVVDGDTIDARVRIWIGQDVTVAVRIRGIDAPELKGRCPLESAMAADAAERLASLAGSRLSLTEIGEDKYGGRVLAHVENAGGGDVAALMLASGLARPYVGGRRGDWCAQPVLGQR